ncbi:alpha/beta hydrolase [Thauera mechernichensis]
MNAKPQHTTSQDAWVNGRQGRLFVRSWMPTEPSARAPIVLLHDSLGSVELWRGFPAELCKATGRQVFAYDRLGFGRSDPHPGRLAQDFIADEAEADFAAVIDQLDLARFIVFGHSVGGGMAVNCAVRHAAACVALITESAQAFVEDRTVAGIEDARELFKDPGQVERLARYHGDKARWVLDAWIGSWLHPDFAAWSLRAVLPEVKCPSLVIHGIDDEYGSPAHPALIAELSAGPAQLALMAETRHVPHREREAEVVAMVRSFLSALP